MSTQTKIEAEKIRTYQDLMKFIENADALEQRGVDIDALQDYYSEEIQELMREGIIKAK